MSEYVHTYILTIYTRAHITKLRNKDRVEVLNIFVRFTCSQDIQLDLITTISSYRDGTWSK